MALVYAEVGDLDRAAELIPAEPPLIDGWPWLGVATAAAHNRVTFGNHANARILGDHLRPYSGRLATVGTGPAFGDVDMALGRIAHLLGDDDAALRHYGASVDLLGRAGAVPWLVRALLHRHEITGGSGRSGAGGRGRGHPDLPLLAGRVRERQAVSK